MSVERSLIGLKYNNEIYYYIKNMQEDIIGITDSNNNILCSYEYDSWGNIINIRDNDGNIITETSHIGAVNPFRYRSYYYDNETKLYYLNSRYYNPEWGRFINADNYITTDTGVLGHNMYLYCNNNTIDGIDEKGKWFKSLINKIIKSFPKVVDLTSRIERNNEKQNRKARKEIEAVQDKYQACPINNEEFANTLRTNAEKIKNETKNMNFTKKSLYFAKNVNDGAIYDLKLKTNETIYYNDMFMEPQDIGNYHFGYIGRAAGFSQQYLLWGASANQVTKMNGEVFRNCFTSSICDDPRDQYFIRLGAIAYDNDNQ